MDLFDQNVLRTLRQLHAERPDAQGFFASNLALKIGVSGQAIASSMRRLEEDGLVTRTSTTVGFIYGFTSHNPANTTPEKGTPPMCQPRTQRAPSVPSSARVYMIGRKDPIYLSEPSYSEVSQEIEYSPGRFFAAKTTTGREVLINRLEVQTVLGPRPTDEPEQAVAQDTTSAASGYQVQPPSGYQLYPPESGDASVGDFLEGDE
jgi:hypothetical protein